MKIFISWSDNRSRAVAKALNDWLPKVIQVVKPFYSPEIEKGTKGIDEVNASLEGTSFGIICLTRENLESRWIHYEAGALAKTEGARVWTLLLGVNHSDVAQPLAQFQHTVAQKEDIFRLLDSINKKLSPPLEPKILIDSFEKWWSDLEDELQKAEKLNTQKPESAGENVRPDREILNEILELLRFQQRSGADKTLTTGRLGFRQEQPLSSVIIDFISKENQNFDSKETTKQIEKVFLQANIYIRSIGNRRRIQISPLANISKDVAMFYMEKVVELLDEHIILDSLKITYNYH